MKKLFILLTMMLILLVVALMSCTPVLPISQPAFPTLLPILDATLAPAQVYILDASNPDAQSAQATLDAGQRELNDLSYQATLVSLNINLAARAAAQATVDYNQAQLMGLAIRGTEVAQNMAWAAATQQLIAAQTQAVWDATTAAQQYSADQTQVVWNTTATAQSQAVTATYSAYILYVTQTSQAQMVMDVRTTQMGEANATQMAYSLTATPRANIQADIAQTRSETTRRAAWTDFVVNPITIFLITLMILLIIIGWVLAYRRFMPVIELSLRKSIHEDNRPLVLVEGRIVEIAPNQSLITSAETEIYTPKLPQAISAQVEIVNPDDPSVTNWIAEAEQKLRSDGWIHL